MRNNIDFCIYYFKFNKGKCIISAVNIVILALLLKSSPVDLSEINVSNGFPKLNLIALTGYIFNVFWSVLDLILDVKSYSKKGYDLKSAKCVEEISAPAGYELEEVENIGTAVYSDAVDEFLINTKSLKMRIDKRVEKKIKTRIKEKRDILFTFLQCQLREANANDIMFFNEKKLCLSCDESGWKNGITCYKGEYYDTFLTNISSNKILIPNSGENLIIADGRKWFPCYEEKNKYYLKSLATSGMNNEIGISTLGITKDNYLFIWRQNEYNFSSRGFFASSGSGSCDWNDYKKGDNDFIKVISSAMKRELWEESGGKQICKKYEQIGDTKVIGYFRWLEKGGKPEFLGVTKLNSDYSPIKANTKEIIHGEEIKITEENIEDKINELMQRKKVSLPLHMNLFALKNYITKNREEAFKFLFSK